MQRQVKKWKFLSILIALIPFSLEAQEKPEFTLFDRIDFHVGGSVDFAYSQTPLHYLSYMSDSQMMKLPADLQGYFENARKTVSSGIGFGGIFGAGYRFKPNSPISLGLEYQISSAGSEASSLTYNDGSGDQGLSLTAGYLDHRLRLYTKLTPSFHEKLAFSVNIFMGLAIIQLQEIAIKLNDKSTYMNLASLKYADGSRIFSQNPYVGFDIGIRASLYMLDAGFDLAITPLFIIPRFLIGFSINQATLKILKAH